MRSLTCAHSFDSDLVIEILIKSYYGIVKKTVTDMVPKMIMLMLVGHAKDGLQNELLAELYKPDMFDTMLEESEEAAQRRKQCKRQIAFLSQAERVVSES